MRGVDADLKRLQPVAVDVALECKRMAVRRDEAVDLGKCRRLALAQIGPEDAALLQHGIGALFDVLAELRLFWLGRRLQALARRIVEPAMKGATKAAVFKPAKGKVGAAVRAMPLDQAVASLLVPKQ